jgi:para-nitrobenzyl esterase
VVDGWVIPEPIEDIFQNGRQNDVPIIVGTTAKEMSSLTSPAGLPNTTAELKERISRHFPNSQFSDFVAAFGGGDDDTARDAILALIQTNGFSSQMRQWARATDNVSSDAFVYYFTRVPPIENSEYLGAYHSSDVPYAFQNIDPEFGKVDQAVSDVMSDYWVNFAKTGDPNGTGLPKWEPYNSDAEPYMELGETPSAGNHLLKKEFDFLEMRDE